MLIPIYEIIVQLIFSIIILYGLINSSKTERLLFIIIGVYYISSVLQNNLYVNDDLLIALSFLSIPTLLRYFSKNKLNINKIFLILAALYLFIAILFTLKNGYNVRGSLFAVTTYKLMIINIICFNSYINIINSKNTITNYTIIIFTLILVFLSMGKWQILFIILNIYLLFFVLRISKIYILCLSIIIMIILNYFINNLSEYGTLTEYFNKRVFDFNSDSALMLLRDGSRYEMWKDLLNKQFSEHISIIIGMGLGVRAFSEKYSDSLPPEDHNLIIFIMVRFGFIVGPFILFTIINKVNKVIKSTANEKCRKIKVYLFMNCAFISLVTTPFTKVLSIIIFCFVICQK